MPDASLPLDRILCGDAYRLIAELPDECIDLVITSPPYFQQRDYGGGIGGEPTVEAYIDRLVAMFRECVRVIRPEGNLVFNVGDKYIKGSLLLVPYRFAIAASDLGIAKLVNEITWVKRNPTPRQFRRRLVSSTEPFFHFVKSDGYYYDIDAFQREHASKPRTKNGANVGKRYFELIETSDLTPEQKAHARAALMEAIREVHQGKIAGVRMKIRGIHAEAFGGQSGGRQIQLERNGFTIIRLRGKSLKRDLIESPVETVKGSVHPAIYPVQVVAELLHLLTPSGGIVLDPFVGSGSTAVACKKTGRHYIGFELNPDYCREAERRIAEVEPTETLF